jgi:oligopeptide/dipeptide ABC transporter ATP-binding protein
MTMLASEAPDRTRPSSTQTPGAPTLVVENLSIDIVGRRSRHAVVRDVSLSVAYGETLGIVGESGSGKSITMRALLGLVPSPPMQVVSGTAMFLGQDLLKLGPREMARVRGGKVGMVFQDPLSSLNPLQRCADQIEESLKAHSGLDAAGRRARVLELLAGVGIPDPERRGRRYPHEFSGGMRQRVMIAIALANNPALLVADEPTTALDVTIQAQVMELFRSVGQRQGLSMVLISHDLGLIAENAQRILVLYAGRVMETGTSRNVLGAPTHPYTVALIRARPNLADRKGELVAIPGRPPSIEDRPAGCPFHPRCQLSRGREICAREVPALRPVAGSANLAACHFAEESAEAGLAASRIGGAQP